MTNHKFSRPSQLVLGLALLFLSAAFQSAGAAPAGIQSVRCKVSSLVRAINKANADVGADTLELSPKCVYSLKKVNHVGASSDPNGLPLITSEITINGNGARIQRKEGDSTPEMRLFKVDVGGILTLHDLTLRGGSTGDDGGAIRNSGGHLKLAHVSLTFNKGGAHGGAIASDNFGTLDVTDSELWYNEASIGGGIYNFGPMNLTGTSFLHNAGAFGGGLYMAGGSGSIVGGQFAKNTASAEGGALLNSSPLLLTVSGTRFIENDGTNGGAVLNGGDEMVILNSAFGSNRGAYGGALFALRPTDVKSSTFDTNTATVQGGAIYHRSGQLNLSNTTFHGNSAQDGGALYNRGDDTSFINSTIANNDASGDGGGIFMFMGSVYPGTVTLANSIIANNTVGGNCGAQSTITDGGDNLRWPPSDTSCIGMFADPKLGALRDNGGSTLTIALEPGSAALNAGHDSTCGSAPVNGVDQRGLARPQGAHCDIGAYEEGPATDLSLDGAALYDPVALSANQVFEFNVRNLGNKNAQNLVFTSDVPAGTTFQAVSAPSWSCSTPPVDGQGTIRCTKPNLGSIVFDLIKVTVRVNASLAPGAILSSTAAVASDTLDLGHWPNSATAESCAGTAAAPLLRFPAKGSESKAKRVLLEWSEPQCADDYTVIVRHDSKKGKMVAEVLTPDLHHRTQPLIPGNRYFWRVVACNSIDCIKSAWGKFRVK